MDLHLKIHPQTESSFNYLRVDLININHFYIRLRFVDKDYIKKKLGKIGMTCYLYKFIIIGDCCFLVDETILGK